MFRDLQEKWHP